MGVEPDERVLLLVFFLYLCHVWRAEWIIYGIRIDWRREDGLYKNVAEKRCT